MVSGERDMGETDRDRQRRRDRQRQTETDRDRQREKKRLWCYGSGIQKGFQNAVILPKLENETYYRISLGSAKNMDLAYIEAAHLKKDKKIDIWVFKKD